LSTEEPGVTLCAVHGIHPVSARQSVVAVVPSVVNTTVHGLLRMGTKNNKKRELHFRTVLGECNTKLTLAVV
jgi:hypothetical protein